MSRDIPSNLKLGGLAAGTTFGRFNPRIIVKPEPSNPRKSRKELQTLSVRRGFNKAEMGPLEVRAAALRTMSASTHHMPAQTYKGGSSPDFR